jgi:hypothetical protein
MYNRFDNFAFVFEIADKSICAKEMVKTFETLTKC